MSQPSNNGSRASGPDLRRSILDTSRHLLVAEGYSGLSMRRIAKSVGCSATSIYLHFESKDALVHTLIDEGMDMLYQQLRQAYEEVELPLERIKAMCSAYVEFGSSNPEYYEVMFMLHPERMERYPAEKYRRARRNLEIFQSAIERAADAGHIDRSDAELQTQVRWTALHGAVALMIARRVDVRIDREVYVGGVISHAVAGLSRSHSAV